MKAIGLVKKSKVATPARSTLPMHFRSTGVRHTPLEAFIPLGTPAGLASFRAGPINPGKCKLALELLTLSSSVRHCCA